MTREEEVAAQSEVRRLGLFASLTPEQQAAALAYAGPVAFGRSGLPKIKRSPWRAIVSFFS